MESKTFNYTYSASKNAEVESIREKYLPKDESKIERLKKLDSRAQSAGMIESLCLGIVGVLVFGIGICYFLNVFVGEVWLAALFMIIGTLIMLPAYPCYRLISKRVKSELTPEILSLSEEIMRG